MTTHELKRAMQIFEQYVPDAKVEVSYQGKLYVDVDAIVSPRHQTTLCNLGWRETGGTWSREVNS